MAQTSGFFNALKNIEGDWDRKYNANSYSENLAVIISNGVLRSSDDDLKVTANGLTCSVGIGRAWIQGRWYKNDSPYVFAETTAPSSGSRYDRIMLRLNNNMESRDIKLVYVQGTAAATPTKPAPTRSGEIYDLVLADIYITANSTSLTVTDTRADSDICGWVYSTSGDGSFFTTFDNKFDEWFEGKKDDVTSVTVEVEHKQRTKLTESTKLVQITIPQYDSTINQKLNVYVNGMLQYEGINYTVSGTVITFTNTLVAGTEITIVITVARDGTGISSVVDDVTELQNKVASLESGLMDETYTYICNGANDNVKLSDIAQTWLSGGTDYGSLKVNVYGNFGATAAYAGSGTSATPYRWLSVGTNANTNRKIIFDFSSAGNIILPIASGTSNVVFYGYNAHIIGANVIVNQTGQDTVVRAFSADSGTVYAENCSFWFTCYKDSVIANTGTFTNCRASVANTINNCYCFLPYSGSLLRINGGEYYAYTGTSTAKSAIVGQSGANAVSILYGVNAPTLARSGYYQTNSIIQFDGGGMLNCTDLVSTLPLTVVSGISNVRGTIALSKSGLG